MLMVYHIATFLNITISRYQTQRAIAGIERHRPAENGDCEDRANAIDAELIYDPTSTPAGRRR